MTSQRTIEELAAEFEQQRREDAQASVEFIKKQIRRAAEPAGEGRTP